MRKSALKKQFLYPLLTLLLWLITASCANIVTPTGGPRDVEPPKVISSEPSANITGYSGKTIKINFDEFIKLTDVAKQLIISPYLAELPDVKVRGKSVLVTFSDSMQASTTYSLDFGNAISDITENNSISGYHFVFSTGVSLDTFQVKGYVNNALNKKAEADVFVMLYNHFNDSTPLIETPFYLTRTGADGSFIFSNIQKGNYKIFALKDMNSNYLFDQPNEKIAFLDSLVDAVISETIQDSAYQKNEYKIYLNLFEEEASIQKLLKSYPAMYGKVNFVFRKPAENIVLKEINKKGSGYKQEINSTKDTLTLWMNNADDDSLIIEVRENNVVLDTAEISLLKKGNKTDARRSSGTPTLTIKNNISNKASFDFFKPVIFTFSNPVSTFDFKKIIVTENKDTITPPISFDYSYGGLSDTILRKLTIDYKWKEGTNYSIFIAPTTFQDIFGLQNDTLLIKFKTAEAEDYCTINLMVKPINIKGNLIIQLIHENDVIADEKFMDGEGGLARFEYVKPGNYKLKLIEDVNNNGRWDTGNYLKKKQPEKVLYNVSPVQAKANWDLELEWLPED